MIGGDRSSNSGPTRRARHPPPNGKGSAVDLQQRRAQYDSREHRELRDRLLRTTDPGTLCPKCHLPLGTMSPERLDLGHNEARTGYTGLEHRRCNRGAGARNATAARLANRAGVVPYRPARQW